MQMETFLVCMLFSISLNNFLSMVKIASMYELYYCFIKTHSVVFACKSNAWYKNQGNAGQARPQGGFLGFNPPSPDIF